jgi:hypothetical protein
MRAIMWYNIARDVVLYANNREINAGVKLCTICCRAFSRNWFFSPASPAILGVSLVIGLAACTQPAPPSAKTTTPIPPAAQINPKQAVVLKHEAIWSFETSDVQCTARAADKILELYIAVHRNANIYIKFMDKSHKESGKMSAKTYILRFQSNKEFWDIIVKSKGPYSVETELPLNDDYMSRILILLDGGFLTKIERGHILANLHMPPADAQGQKWFDCVREKSL